MKRFLSVLLIMIMVLSLAACGGKKEDNTTAADPGVSEFDQLPADATPIQKIMADFSDKARSGEFKSTADLADALANAGYLPFSGATMEVEPGFLNGFTAEIEGFKEGYMFGPVIGSIPFIGYVFVVDGDITSFTGKLNEYADLRWNICTQADEMQYRCEGNLVCFVMSPTDFEE